MSSTSSLLVKALKREHVDHVPLWLMRQAGRYLPEYRRVRSHFADFMTFCLHPEAATEVTLQPVELFDLDAAIIFADILTIPHALGHRVVFEEGSGPRVALIEREEQVQGLKRHVKNISLRLSPVCETVRRTRRHLPPHKAVIGFSGGPFTLACYMMDDKPSMGIPRTLHMANSAPETFADLLQTLSEAVSAYLVAQVKAGADAIQIFESWALSCPPTLWDKAIHQPLQAIARKVREEHPEVPIIFFPRGASPAQLKALADDTPPLATTTLSLSTEVDMKWAGATLFPAVSLQGNLDPGLFAGAPDPLLEASRRILAAAAPCRGGFVFNVGHGLTPQTRVDNVRRVVDLVHAWQG